MDITNILKFGGAALTSAVYIGGTFLLTKRDVPDTY